MSCSKSCSDLLWPNTSRATVEAACSSIELRARTEVAAYSVSGHAAVLICRESRDRAICRQTVWSTTGAGSQMSGTMLSG
jgi:hypothetical protein